MLRYWATCQTPHKIAQNDINWWILGFWRKSHQLMKMMDIRNSQVDDIDVDWNNFFEIMEKEHIERLEIFGILSHNLMELWVDSQITIRMWYFHWPSQWDDFMEKLIKKIWYILLRQSTQILTEILLSSLELDLSRLPKKIVISNFWSDCLSF